MKKQAPCGAAQKIFAAVHPDWRLAASDNVAAVTARIPPLTENRKETNMQEMTNFTHTIELSNEELDLVAAGWSNECGCSHKGESNTQVGLVNLNDVNVGVNILGIQSQRA